MCFFMVPQNPKLSVGVVTPGKTTLELIGFVFLVSSQVVLEMLGHLEGLVAPRIGAVIVPHLKMALQVLLLLRVLVEDLLAA